MSDSKYLTTLRSGRIPDGLETAEEVHSLNDVYADPPRQERFHPFDHTSGIVEEAKDTREDMVGRLFNYAKPADMRRGVYKDAPPAREDETLTDAVSRLTGRT